MYIDKCKYKEEYDSDGGHYYVFTGPCVMTGEDYSVRVPGPGLFQWRNGSKHIQDALPDLSAGDREFLMTGTSPTGWNNIFGDPVHDPGPDPDSYDRKEDAHLS